MQKVTPAQIMFPGLSDFHSIVRQNANGTPPRVLDNFFTMLESSLRQISGVYMDQTVSRITQESSVGYAIDRITQLQQALRDTKTKPFSEVISPYINIENGTVTPLGNLLLMSRSVAQSINGPDSEVVALMKSLSQYGITFERLAGMSYEAFDYAKSNIALSQGSGTSAPARPLFWLPLGNSLFVKEVKEFLTTTNGPVTVVNLGAGPGGLEQLLVDNLSSFGDRLRVVSVEMDAANLESLRRVSSSLPNHTILPGNFVAHDTRVEVTKAISQDSTKFVLAGYVLHHISPDKLDNVLQWMNKVAGPKGVIQIHDVTGGTSGGGQSNVNRLFFNFMTAYHLLAFAPDSFYTQRGFSVMAPAQAHQAVRTAPELFVPGTTPANAFEMLMNGSIVVFRSGKN